MKYDFTWVVFFTGKTLSVRYIWKCPSRKLYLFCYTILITIMRLQALDIKGQEVKCSQIISVTVTRLGLDKSLKKTKHQKGSKTN